jgi:hypothetical protein
MNSSIVQAELIEDLEICIANARKNPGFTAVVTLLAILGIVKYIPDTKIPVLRPQYFLREQLALPICFEHWCRCGVSY